MESKQRLVVIGGSSGIGLSISKLMIRIEYELIIASHSKTKLSRAKEEIGEIEAHVLDVTTENNVANFFLRSPFLIIYTEKS
jgi:short-subunit dehydrogenase involved in D-alanine esterification of teichoic acids